MIARLLHGKKLPQINSYWLDLSGWLWLRELLAFTMHNPKQSRRIHQKTFQKELQEL
jgi:hypothetical protein